MSDRRRAQFSCWHPVNTLVLSLVVGLFLLVTASSWVHPSRHCDKFSHVSTLRGTSLFMSGSGSPPKHVVIAGAGVIGVSTAYYLLERFGISCTLVDPTGQVAPAASGKAGGFLALDWNDVSPLGPLARRSFDLHQDIADSLGAEKIQYRRLTCAAVSVDPSQKRRRPGGKKLEGVEWANTDEVLGMSVLGDENTIAQVHPKLFCEALWEVASTPNHAGADPCRLIKGRVVSPVFEHDRLVGAKLDDNTVLDADAILFACGPWTTNIMTGVKYHSVVIPTSRVLGQSVFFDGCGDPEVYPRPDSTAYCTGFPDPAIPVTEYPGEEEVRPEAVSRIVQAVRAASGVALSASPSKEQACYLPTTPDGLPIMGLLPQASVGGGNCYVAAGHSCWGILLGPATGESMAHLIATGQATEYVNLQPYDPARFAGVRLRDMSRTSRETGPR